MHKDLKALCTPAKIYLAIAVFASVVSLMSGIKFMLIGVKLLFAIIWTFLLGLLCKHGFHYISWFLVLLPYIILGLAILNIHRVTHKQKQIMRTIQLQDVYGQ